MRRLATAGLVVLAMVLLSGCFGDGKAANTTEPRKFGAGGATPKFASPAEEALGVRSLRVAKEEVGGWWVVSGRSSPEGALSAFVWAPPPNAVIGLAGMQSKGVFLEVAPIVVNGTGPESWCLLGFSKADGKLRSMRADLRAFDLPGTLRASPLYCQAASSTVNRTLLQTGGAASAAVVAPANHKPFLIQLPLTGASFNETYWVLAARGAEPMDFGLALRAFPEFPERAAKPAFDVAEFVANRGGVRPYPLKVAGTGSGFQYASYLGATRLVTDLAAPGFVSTDVRTGPLKVTERLSLDPRPAAATREVAYEAAADKPGGWSMTWGSYRGLCSMGRWEAAAKLGGNDVSARGVVWYPDLCTAAYGSLARIALGSPFFIFGGEGPGDARASFALQYASATTEETVFGHVALGETLLQLFGAPAAPLKFTGLSIVGNVPP